MGYTSPIGHVGDKLIVGALDVSFLASITTVTPGTFVANGPAYFGLGIGLGVARATVMIGPPIAVSLPASLEVTGITNIFGIHNVIAVSTFTGLTTKLGTTIKNALSLKNGIDIKNTSAVVKKTMSRNPRRISRIDIDLIFPRNYDSKIKVILERAAKNCPVHHSLSEKIEKNITFKYLN